MLTRTSTEQPTVHDGFPNTWFWHSRWTKEDLPTPAKKKQNKKGGWTIDSLDGININQFNDSCAQGHTFCQVKQNMCLSVTFSLDVEVTTMNLLLPARQRRCGSLLYNKPPLKKHVCVKYPSFPSKHMHCRISKHIFNELLDVSTWFGKHDSTKCQLFMLISVKLSCLLTRKCTTSVGRAVWIH